MSLHESIWRHEPVMAARVLELMRLQPGMQILEGCTGLGGHTKLFLDIIGDTGHIWGFELDPRVAEEATKRLAAYTTMFTIFNANFRDFDIHLANAGVNKLDAAFFDFGTGFYHYSEMYGMALKKDLPIDFRLSPTIEGPSGTEIVEEASEPELRKLIADAGERRFGGRIARAIVENRPILTTSKLARVIEDAVPRKFHKPGVSPAQRIFGWIRTVVNDELGAIEEMTSKLTSWIEVGGRAVFLCYTSEEFSLIRRYLKGTGCICPTDAPVCRCGKSYKFKVLADGERPTQEEIERNPSARSARLAAGELLSRPEEGQEEE